MGRRYGRFNRDESYWRGDFCSTDYEAFPKFKIVCESENHIGYINVPPKKEFQNPDGYALIDAELHKLCKLRLSYIQMIEKSGITSYAYRRPQNIKPESDMGWHGIIKLTWNRKNVLFLFIERLASDNTDLFCAFLRKFFSDPSAMGNLGILGSESMSGEDVGKKLRKNRHHDRYNMSQKASQESPIEKLFRDELQRRGIEFEEQVEFVLEGKKFSVPDFVIRSAKLLIYCDGIEFHKNPERIIMDKQQDRALQANGFTVFRFSGSEIASGVRKCVDEVEMFIRKKQNTEDIHDIISRQAKKQE
jgi:very-short-patch-repair endonuclease